MELKDDKLIRVRVIKPFKEIRTPCPAKGTEGEIYAFDGDLACVRFALPMTDTNGDEWLTQGEETDYMRLKFTLDEIETISETVMCNIQVVNKKHGGEGEYIGRPSILGNPFVIGKDGTREEVIDAYRTWLQARLMGHNSPHTLEIQRLTALAKEQGHLNLVCWCAPEACHGDVIKESIEWFIDNPRSLEP